MPLKPKTLNPKDVKCCLQDAEQSRKCQKHLRTEVLSTVCFGVSGLGFTVGLPAWGDPFSRVYSEDSQHAVTKNYSFMGYSILISTNEKKIVTGRVAGQMYL